MNNINFKEKIVREFDVNEFICGDKYDIIDTNRGIVISYGEIISVDSQTIQMKLTFPNEEGKQKGRLALTPDYLRQNPHISFVKATKTQIDKNFIRYTKSDKEVIEIKKGVVYNIVSESANVNMYGTIQEISQSNFVIQDVFDGKMMTVNMGNLEYFFTHFKFIETGISNGGKVTSEKIEETANQEETQEECNEFTGSFGEFLDFLLGQTNGEPISAKTEEEEEDGISEMIKLMKQIGANIGVSAEDIDEMAKEAEMRLRAEEEEESFMGITPEEIKETLSQIKNLGCQFKDNVVADIPIVLSAINKAGEDIRMKCVHARNPYSRNEQSKQNIHITTSLEDLLKQGGFKPIFFGTKPKGK